MSGVSGGPRIGLIGSCQVIGLGAAFQKIWPDAEIKTWHIGAKTSDTPESIAEQIAGRDLLVSQHFTPDQSAPLAFNRLKETVPRAVYVPIVVFRGFQPDCIYLAGKHDLILGPLSQMHSAIIAGCFVLGVSEAKAARLFNALTYSFLGYYEAFDTARDFLTTIFAQVGYKIDALIDDCIARDGSFMHTINHPNIHVLSALAQMAAVRSGLADADCPVPDDVEDWLGMSLQWPVYPELARRLALPKGDLDVKLTGSARDHSAANIRKLPDMIGAFYASYTKEDQGALRAAVPARVLAGLEEVLARSMSELSFLRDNHEHSILK